MPKPAPVTVKPSPDLPPTLYVRGVPADGTELPADEAQRLVDAGLVVIVKPGATAAAGVAEATGGVPEKETD